MPPDSILPDWKIGNKIHTPPSSSVPIDVSELKYHVLPYIRIVNSEANEKAAREAIKYLDGLARLEEQIVNLPKGE